MRVGIDCSCLAKPQKTGVARYAASFVRELPALLGPDDRATLLYRVSRVARRRWFERPSDPRFTTAWLNDRFVRWHPRDLDVVHGPDLRLPRIPGVPAVSTIHDLSALDLEGIAGEHFRRRKAAALDDVAARAAAILCISDFTAAQFLRRYPQAAPRVRVVPQGISSRFAPESSERVRRTSAALGLGAPYLLFVGQISARKNLLPLVAAFGRLHDADPSLDLDLVLAGPVQTGGDDVVEAVRRLPQASRVRMTGFVGDDDLAPLYTGAAAFVFPGKAEGFGMPPLEAMACGCPVVAARAGANESTVGDAGVFFDPDDPADLAEALRRVLAPGAERDALVRRGVARAARFTWRETARLTFDAYRDAARAGALA